MSDGATDATAEPLRIALVGLRASGKSRLGPELARRIGLAFVDLDRETARLARTRGVRAPGGARTARAGDVLRVVGEPAFRALEQEAFLGVLAAGVPCVLAAGGGLVEGAPARAALVARCRVVWLDPPLDVLRARLAAATEDRPALLGGRDAATEIDALAERRRPLYASLDALHLVPEPGETTAGLAERVARGLGLAALAPRAGARLAERRPRRYPR